MGLNIEFFLRKILIGIVEAWAIISLESFGIRCDPDGFIEQFPAEEINSVL